MVIVGISGGSGTGKTTVSRGLAKMLPNAISIDVDPYFREATEKLEDEIYKEMNVKKKEGETSQKYFFASFENMNIWIEVVKDYVSNRIEEVVDKLGVGKDYVIVDWCFLPMCDYFYKCDYTICIKADFATRHERLANRLKAVKEYSIATGPSFKVYQPKIFENRVRYTALNEYGYQSEYDLVNDSDMEALEKCVKTIAESIQSINNPGRYIEVSKNNSVGLDRSRLFNVCESFNVYESIKKNRDLFQSRARTVPSSKLPMNRAASQTIDAR